MSDEKVTALKLRALAAHEACWESMNRPQSEAYAAICDGGAVHEAIHAILSVDTEQVTVPEEWRAHLDRQDRRIERLEAELALLRAQSGAPPMSNGA